ncbi:hypothetical protein EYF80_000548 [Liparis tanakae]|uniref:Uncharacterized protein n=1 Tax=Liparis tanakae TaxID=230148 RepID=A0A4Z2JGD2_9TELE|nr:hypothetical protein EYF80_000548 [Liparis tanakae]
MLLVSLPEMESEGEGQRTSSGWLMLGEEAWETDASDRGVSWGMDGHEERPSQLSSGLLFDSFLAKMQQRALVLQSHLLVLHVLTHHVHGELGKAVLSARKGHVCILNLWENKDRSLDLQLIEVTRMALLPGLQGQSSESSIWANDTLSCWAMDTLITLSTSPSCRTDSSMDSRYWSSTAIRCCKTAVVTSARGTSRLEVVLHITPVVYHVNMSCIYLWSWSLLDHCELWCLGLDDLPPERHFSQSHWESLLPEENHGMESRTEKPFWAWLPETSYCQDPD